MESDDKDAPPAVMSEKEAAQYLGLKEHQLRYWRRNNILGRPPHRDMGKRIVYTRKALDDWLDQG